jgi:hypothetical protein
MDLEILEETYMTYQVVCKGQATPAKFTVTYANTALKGKANDLKIFYSSVHKEPNDKQHQQVFPSPDKFYISANQKEGFENENMYVSFYSF